MRELKSKLTGMRELMLLLIVVIVFIAMSLISPYFFTSANLTSVLLTLSIEAILVVGMVNLLISGGFDMSIGSVIGLAGGVAAFLMKNVGVPIWISIICAIAAGGLVGLFNGTAVAKLGIPPFVATLASKYMANGLLLVLMSGRTISGLPDEFTWIGQARIGQLQIPVIYMIIIVALGEFLLRKSRFFRQNYYIGGNFKAAKLSGIHNERMQIFNYVLMGLLAGLSGVIMSARLGQRLHHQRPELRDEGHHRLHHRRHLHVGRRGLRARRLPGLYPDGHHHQFHDPAQRQRLLADVRNGLYALPCRPDRLHEQAQSEYEEIILQEDHRNDEL